MKRLFWNSVASSADIIILIALSLIATPVLIKYFGTAGYGVFIFLSVFNVNGALSFFDLGLEGALMMHVARYETSEDYVKIQNALFTSEIYYGVIGTVVALLLCFSAQMITASFSGSELNDEEILRAVYLVALNALLQFISIPLIAVLQGLHHFTITKGVNSILNILQYIVLMMLSIYTGRIDLAFLGISIITLIKLFFIIYAYNRIRKKKLKTKLDFEIFRAVWVTSNTLFLNRIIGLVYNQLGKFIIWWKMPIASMAIYDVVNRPASLIRVLGGMVNSAVIPEMARLKSLNEQETIKFLYIRLIRYAYILVMPPIVTIFINASKILEYWIGVDYTQYASMVQMLMIIAFVMPLPSVASTVVVGLDIVKKVQWISVIGTLVYILGALIAVKFLGMMGLFVGMLVAEIVMWIPYFQVMRKNFNIRKRELIGPLLKFLVLGISVGLVHLTLLTEIENRKLWVIGVFSITIMHYCIQMVLLLEKSEHKFLINKLMQYKK